MTTETQTAVKLYEYYKYNATTKTLSIVPDPWPEDGYSHEPLAYVDPDDSAEDALAFGIPNLPFNGIIYSWTGDCETEMILEGVDTGEELHNLPDLSERGYYYRTGIYEDNEDYTGYDAIVWCEPEFEFEDD